MPTRPTALAVATALALQPAAAAAIALGPLSVSSHLGEPLEASITLRASEGDASELIDIAVQPAEGMPALPLLRRLESGPDASISRELVLRLETDQPVREPVAGFRIVARAPSGQVAREYTLMLDPPSYRGAALGRDRSAPIARRPAAEPRRQSVAPAAKQPPSPALAGAAPGTVVRVGSGQTLWEIGTAIAAGTRVAGSQMAWALFVANPDAFAGDGVETLRAGAALTVPGVDAAAAVSSSRARAWLRGGAAPVALARNGAQPAPGDTTVTHDTPSGTGTATTERSNARAQAEFLPSPEAVARALGEVPVAASERRPDTETRRDRATTAPPAATVSRREATAGHGEDGPALRTAAPTGRPAPIARAPVEPAPRPPSAPVEDIAEVPPPEPRLEPAPAPSALAGPVTDAALAESREVALAPLVGRLETELRARSLELAAQRARISRLDVAIRELESKISERDAELSRLRAIVEDAAPGMEPPASIEGARARRVGLPDLESLRGLALSGGPLLIAGFAVGWSMRRRRAREAAHD